jgi:hypothetical protein
MFLPKSAYRKVILVEFYVTNSYLFKVLALYDSLTKDYDKFDLNEKRFFIVKFCSFLNFVKYLLLWFHYAFTFLQLKTKVSVIFQWKLKLLDMSPY